jgi:hypothetical protein
MFTRFTLAQIEDGRKAAAAPPGKLAAFLQ